jgi:hypothetical protein
LNTCPPSRGAALIRLARCSDHPSLNESYVG